MTSRKETTKCWSWRHTLKVRLTAPQVTSKLLFLFLRWRHRLRNWVKAYFPLLWATVMLHVQCTLGCCSEKPHAKDFAWHLSIYTVFIDESHQISLPASDSIIKKSPASFLQGPGWAGRSKLMWVLKSIFFIHNVMKRSIWLYLTHGTKITLMFKKSPASFLHLYLHHHNKNMILSIKMVMAGHK